MSLFALLAADCADGVRLDISVLNARSRHPLDGAYVVIADQGLTVTTDSEGHVAVDLGAGNYTVAVTHVGYQTKRQRVVMDSLAQELELLLQPTAVEVAGTVSIASREKEVPGRISLALTELERAPAPTPDPVRFVKVLPGVTSGNDFSNAYNVRGGSYTENAIYVNGIEIEPPLQIRRSLAETMSPVNPALIDRADFHAGAFPVRYGGKLSSVLDVEYRVPGEGLRSQISVSTLQQSVTGEGRVAPSLTYVSGVRRADLSRLTNGLQTSGRYRPMYRDWQGVMTWQPRQDRRVSLYHALIRSTYEMVPSRLALRYNCRLEGGEAACDEFRGEPTGREFFSHHANIIGVRWTEGPNSAYLSVVN